MPFNYDVEKDSLYLQGYQIGYQKGIILGKGECAHKLTKAGFSIEEISTIFELSIKEVKSYIKKFKSNTCSTF